MSSKGKWHKEKWGTNEEPVETPTERPHCDKELIKNEMTINESIIIDGVDVSGCDFLAKEDIYDSYSGITTAYKGQCGCSDDEMCKSHRNCGYKKLARQLQRKTAECEELKKTAITLSQGLSIHSKKLQIATEALKNLSFLDCRHCPKAKNRQCYSSDDCKDVYRSYAQQALNEIEEYCRQNRHSG